MGIGCGVSPVLQRLSRGLYKLHNLKRVTMYVDGELIRYKGMVQDNLICSDAEEAIAKTSYEYLAKLRDDVETHLKIKMNDVVVFMDGARTENKTTNRSTLSFDKRLIRQLFGAYCTDNGMRMRWLEEGESEMWMYRQRDRENDLNVFVSSDSDLLAIMYGHKPVCSDTATPNKQEFSPEGRGSLALRDGNRVYADGTGISDSCLWVKCDSSVKLYGMDDLESLIRMRPKVFRVLMGLCGTDYTPAIFTETMAQVTILGFSDVRLQADIDLVNRQTDPLLIMAGLLYFAVSHGGTLKRNTNCPQTYNIGETRGMFKHAENMLTVYTHYVETGVMLGEIMRPSGTYLLRLCLFAMIGLGMKLSKHALHDWTRRVPLQRALQNFTENKDSDLIHHLVIDTFESSGSASKRKASMYNTFDAKRLKCKYHHQ